MASILLVKLYGEELWSRRCEKYVLLRSDQAEVRHRDRVNEVAVDDQPDFHCVSSECDHVREGTG